MVKLYENEVVTKHEFEMINITNEVKKAVADSGTKTEWLLLSPNIQLPEL